MSTVSVPESVTVSIVRKVRPDDHMTMLAWVRAGMSMAERFPGFLGSGWVRPSADSGDWHMLYRFEDAECLAAWEQSAERSWWLRSGDGLVEHARVERRTGIEGWFDAPPATSAEDFAEPSFVPPRWKQAVVIWMAFFPLNLLATLTVGALVVHWNVVLRVLILTLCLTPIMTYFLLPAMTRLMHPWLHRAPRTT